ncbi:MAG: M61 family metallopeptidase [Vulcanimicrobiota bacterium]
MRILLGVVLLLMSLPVAAETITYSVSFSPSTHYLEVEANMPAGSPVVTLPVWTPGSYKVRDYSGQVENMQAYDPAGTPIATQKVRKNRWQVASPGAYNLKYRIYAHEPSVRNNWVDQEYALIVGAATFVTPFERGPFDYRVQLELPSEWQSSYSGLAEVGPNTFGAADYDELVDCPILAGNPAVYTFTVGGKPHYLVNVGEAGVWDGPGSARDVKKVVETQLALWGQLPYDKYLFFNIINETHGGLEHRNSTVLMTSLWKRQTEQHQAWCSLVAHEFFHAWNVKRLRPVELGPFDYENEVYTRSLWVAEGITSYYDDLLVARAGLANEADYLKALSKSVERLQTTPGRKVRSLAEASFDAWIKLYAPDENTNNTNISYYTKGALVSWLLDIEIRQATGGQKTLDDLLRLAYQRFAKDGFEEQAFRQLASEVAGKDLSGFFSRNVDSTQELDYAPALTYFGLRFKPPENQANPAGWLGAKLATDNFVTEVPRDTPAYRASLQPGDELLGLDQFRLPPDGLEERLKQYAPGTQVELLVARRGRLFRLPARLEGKPTQTWTLEPDPAANPTQTARRNQWLGSSKTANQPATTR